jgi:hypothetical protein
MLDIGAVRDKIGVIFNLRKRNEGQGAVYLFHRTFRIFRRIPERKEKENERQSLAEEIAKMPKSYFSLPVAVMGKRNAKRKLLIYPPKPVYPARGDENFQDADKGHRQSKKIFALYKLVCSEGDWVKYIIKYIKGKQKYPESNIKIKDIVFLWQKYVI